MVPRPHAPPLRPLGRGAQRRLADQPPALLRRADPAVVSRRRRRRGRLRPPDRSRRGRPADRPVDRRPAGLHRRAARPARRLRRRPRRHGHVGDVVADAADRRRLDRRPRPVRPRVPDGPAPAGPDIIRTWLFATVVRSHYEHDSLPWANAAINGWILDPDRKKMSKSVGNVVTPMALFEQYGTDAVRYWSLSARPGVDTAYSEEQMKVGRRLATKLLNVTKFVLGIGDDAAAEVTAEHEAVDAAMLARLDGVVAEATDGVRRLRLRPGAGAHRGVLLVVLRRLRRARQGSRLRQPRRARPQRRRATRCAVPSTCCSDCSPRRSRSPPRKRGAGGTTAASTRPAWPERRRRRRRVELSLDPISEVLASVRRVKTEAKVSQRAAVATLDVRGPAEWVASIEAARDDLAEALSVDDADARRSGRSRHRRDARLSGCRRYVLARRRVRR